MDLDPQLSCPEGLVYDDEVHSYALDGSPVPAVSTLLNIALPDLYEGIREDVLMRAAERGHNRHAMVALDVRDNLDFGSLDDDMLADWAAWDEFRHLTNFEVQHSERCVVSRKHKFAGTLDLAGVLTYKGRRDLWVIDEKYTAQRPALVDVQLAGYKQGAAESLPGYENARRGCLWIRDGKFKFSEATNPSDLSVLLAARTIHHWRNTK